MNVIKRTLKQVNWRPWIESIASVLFVLLVATGLIYWIYRHGMHTIYGL